MRDARRTIIGIAVSAGVLLSAVAARADVVRDIEFPVNGAVSFRDDFGEPRSGGRVHEGVDMLGSKMMPLVSAIDGVVHWRVEPEASWGYAIVLRDFDGWTYHYLHVNNDTPGTDDDSGGVQYAYAPGMYAGVSVSKGQHVAWMGDSGNAENVSPHLHFEIRMPDGTAINPYQSLVAATRSGRYDPNAESAAGNTINGDKGIEADPNRLVYCLSNTLIKSVSSKAVYYCGADGRRYVFPTQKTYDTWYLDFGAVQTITDAELAAIPIGKNVTYRPGVRLVKIQTDPKVYAVARGGVLRWVTSAEIAAKLYGKDWAKKIDDVPDVFFTDYTVGEPITTI